MYLQCWHGWCHMKLLPSWYILCTPNNHAPFHFMQSYIHKVHVCLAVTCHPHFWQNDWDLLHATAITQGWNGNWNLRPFNHESGTLTTELYPCSPCYHATLSKWKWTLLERWDQYSGPKGRWLWMGACRNGQTSMACRWWPWLSSARNHGHPQRTRASWEVEGSRREMYDDPKQAWLCCCPGLALTTKCLFMFIISVYQIKLESYISCVCVFIIFL